jgi:ferredoxin
MADVANKFPQNVSGRFYVDDQCIDCDLCRETASASFTRNADGSHSFVYKQPENAQDEALCKEAMDGCPVEAIGDDGHKGRPAIKQTNDRRCLFLWEANSRAQLPIEAAKKMIGLAHHIATSFG